jgi:hypothetical protein
MTLISLDLGCGQEKQAGTIGVDMVTLESRAYGVANIAVAHRISDLRAQADDGTATAKITAGLLDTFDGAIYLLGWIALFYLISRVMRCICSTDSGDSTNDMSAPASR